MTDVDVAVVGAGVMGLACAWRLAEAGRETVVLERSIVGHERGSSHGATRIFRFVYDHPLYVHMAQETLPLWRELEARSGLALLRMTGGLHVDRPEGLSPVRGALEACGAHFELMTPGERRRRFGWLRAGDEPALWSHDVGVMAADAAVEALRGLVEVREGCAVDRLRAGELAELETSDGPIRARLCVVCAGAWAGPLLEGAGLDLPLRVTREQVVYFQGESVPVPFIHARGTWLYGIPSFLDDGLVKVAEHATGATTTADERSFEPDEAGVARVVSYVREALPDLDPEPRRVETCLYTMTPDEDFVLGRRGPVVVVCACSGHGFKFAPLVGEIVVSLAEGRAAPVELGKFSPARFAG